MLVTDWRRNNQIDWNETAMPGKLPICLAGVAAHAYVLMTSHSHFLRTPGREQEPDRVRAGTGRGSPGDRSPREWTIRMILGCHRPLYVTFTSLYALYLLT
ncbi:uncharacterized protein FOKN1_0633 [Thiohalobacter thiocyanaticus]|uniref:Uncharacterized protein n=1 Tax=Thiohalobacter thiocyanaticus TaxID=585455 RepID=A0A1Z4VNF3_9GAMM|nr:uncharacterized protein FOKN1_0633 [Thiohalobacter thiocyanaticus]